MEINWAEIRTLKRRDKIILHPDPDEGFMDEETVEFRSASEKDAILVVWTKADGIFEVGAEQYKSRAE